MSNVEDRGGARLDRRSCVRIAQLQALILRLFRPQDSMVQYSSADMRIRFNLALFGPHFEYGFADALYLQSYTDSRAPCAGAWRLVCNRREREAPHFFLREPAWVHARSSA